MSDITHFLTSANDHYDLRLLHLMWEHPSRVVGGMGVAGAALIESLEYIDGVAVQVMSPSDRINHEVDEINSYQIEIDIEDALKLQAALEDQGDLAEIKGAIASFANEVSVSQLVDPEINTCDLVHAHDWMTVAAGVIIQRAQGVPLILHIHSTQIDREGRHAKGVVYEHEKWGMQQADLIIAVSDYTKDVIINHYGILADKIRVVRNASRRGGKNFDLKDRDNVNKQPLVVFAGRLVSQKYPEAAVEIMVGALKKVENARGVIVGGGEKLAVIRDLVKFKGMDERIEVLGHVPKKNMHAIYAAAAVLILPSISEPFGLVAMEAASEGVAVMLSDRCGVSEVLKSARVIELYDTDKWIECLAELLEDKELRHTQVQQQLLDVEKYDWSDAGDAVLEIVGTLINE